MPKASPLTFRVVPMPALEAMTPLLRVQLGPLLDQALDDGPDGLSLFDRFEVRRGTKHVYDLALFAGDDGAVYRAGTTERVASFSQGGATGSTDAVLVAQLDAAIAAWQSLPKPSRAPAKAPAKARKGSPLVVSIGPAVPLSSLAEHDGVQSVVIESGRKSFAGLEALPRSVQRLSIRKHGVLNLSALPRDHRLTSMDIEATRVEGPALAHLMKLGWKGATDLAWVARLPALRELALKGGKYPGLPASASLERLLAFEPKGLKRLDGIDGLPRLRFLRLDRPAGMKRLGSLAACTKLSSIVLVGAHAIAELSDLKSAPKLEELVVVHSKIDGTAFESLKGRLKRGGFQLRTPAIGRALVEQLGVAHATVPIEAGFFDA